MPPKKNAYNTPSASSGSIAETGKTSAYNPGFEQDLVDHGVYPRGYRLPGGNRYTLHVFGKNKGSCLGSKHC